MLKIGFIALALGAMGLNVHAQNGVHEGENAVYCTQHHHNNAILNGDTELAEKIQLAEIQSEKDRARYMQSKHQKGGDEIIIPIVFHVLHDNGVENISEEQILDQIRILNEDYNQGNEDLDGVIPEFKSIIGSVNFTFKLATKDPNGDCTNGIIRYRTDETYNASDAVKSGRAWPTERYLNIYTAINIGGAAGYAYLPQTAQFIGDRDGIMILQNYVGSIGTGRPRLSRALTHEVGHWANLPHPWGGTNDPTLSSNCNDDDGVDDTPNTVGWDNCNKYGESCGSLDNVQNFMDYSYCSLMFTEGQADRMRAALNSDVAERSNLWTEENLAFTGTANDAVVGLCEVQIKVDGEQTICEGQSITYTDNSFHNVESRVWTFPGGTPATSTDKTVTVVYSTPGEYEANLEISNSTGSIFGSVNGGINVLSNGALIGGISENFASVNDLDADSRFIIENPDENLTWEITENAGYNDAKSVYLKNRSVAKGEFDRLIIGNFDMSNVSDLELEFKYAYVPRSSQSSDELNVYVSNDCGQNWSLRKRLKGSTLATATQSNTSFVPNGNDEWKESGSISVNANYEAEGVQVMFEWESGSGNNVYLDDINFKSTNTSSLNTQNGFETFTVFPNPANNKVQIKLETKVSGNATIALTDLSGRLVKSFGTSLVPGMNELGLNLTDVANGVYLIQVNTEKGNMAQRVIIE